MMTSSHGNAFRVPGLRGQATGHRWISLTNITLTSWWAWWHLKTPASPLFTQPFIQSQIKENIKSTRHWAFVRGIHRWPGNSPHKWPVMWKMFPFDDVIMNQSVMLSFLFSSHTWNLNPFHEGLYTCNWYVTESIYFKLVLWLPQISHVQNFVAKFSSRWKWEKNKDFQLQCNLLITLSVIT